MAAASCGPRAARQPLYTAGSERDDGHGMLAHASSRLMTEEETDTDALPAKPAPVPRRYEEEYGGTAYGGDSYGGMFGNSAYGGATYASYSPPPWGYPSVNRMPHYQQQVGLTAAVEGTVSWRGAIPKVTSACGTFDPLTISAERGVAGVLVYIERINTGRVLPNTLGEQRPSIVGGVLVKRGCAFAPSVQVVNPLPAQLAIHGDARKARVQITAPGAATAQAFDLAEAGRVALQLKPGITRVESDDASLGAAWIVGVDTPYYAITDETGRFRIDELAAGTYDVTIFQAPVPTVTGGKLSYPPPVVLHRSVRVEAAKTARLDVPLGK